MLIRRAEKEDLTRIMDLYAAAREFMAAHGNPHQWGDTNWPPETLIADDIRRGCSYVCENEEKVAGVFYFAYGRDIEPTYRKIEDGAWMSDEPYGVIHRIATDSSTAGVGTFCFEWALSQCDHMRVDTHTDNIPMQRLLEKLGFEKRGIIYVVEDNYPRYAYEKVGK